MAVSFIKKEALAQVFSSKFCEICKSIYIVLYVRETASTVYHCEQGFTLYPDDIYWLKVNNKNIRTVCEICSKLTIKIPERQFEHILLIVSMFPLLNLNK